jgi:hypothetical protein
MKVGVSWERIAEWSNLPVILEYDRNSILLVFGNRPEFDELRVIGSTISWWLSLVRQDTR